MPSRKPIIPGLSGSKQFLKVKQSESNNQIVVHSRKPLHRRSPRSRTKSLGDRAYTGTPVDPLERVRTSQTAMGRSKRNIEEYVHGDHAAANEDASSSSAPDDDDDDEDQEESDDNEDADNDGFEDASDNSDPDDDFGEERDAKETDDRIAWEHNHSRSPLNKIGVSDSHGAGQRQVRHYTLAQAARDNAIFRKRGSAPTSYVRLVKETEDEIELIRRKHDAMARRKHQGVHPISEKDHKEVMAKRKSTNSITLTYGRQKDGASSSAHTGVVRTTDRQSSSISARALEVEGHLRRLKGGRVTVTPLDQRRVVATAGAGVDAKYNAVQPPRPMPRAIKQSGEEDDSSVLEFPLRDLAVSETHISMSKAKSLERAAKQKTKMLKGDIGWARLDVSEARLGEFAATLRARQAHIEERHAKLCRRRAALKKAEEEQDALESKMDEKEEEHRARERRIKNRERRVRQEEAGIKLKEESLRKREENVEKGIEQIEQRRKIVEEKEEVEKAMKDIMEKKEELHGRDNTNNNNTKTGFLGKFLPKSPEKRSSNHKNRPNTSGSLSSGDSIDINDSKSSSTANKARGNDAQIHGQLHATTKPRSTDANGKARVMGLWI